MQILSVQFTLFIDIFFIISHLPAHPAIPQISWSQFIQYSPFKAKKYLSSQVSHFEELFYFHYLRENEEAEQFLPESGYMDLQDLVREYLVMEIPYAPICKEDCKGLCPICGKNLNLGPCDHPEE